MNEMMLSPLRKGVLWATLTFALCSPWAARAAAPDWANPITCAAWVNDVAHTCKSPDPAVQRALSDAVRAARDAAAFYEQDATRCAASEPLSAASRRTLRQQQRLWKGMSRSSLGRSLAWVAFLRRQACLVSAQQRYVWFLGQLQSLARERVDRSDDTPQACVAVGNQFDLRGLFDSFLQVRQARTLLTFTPSEQAAIEQISACLLANFDADEARDVILGHESEK